MADRRHPSVHEAQRLSAEQRQRMSLPPIDSSAAPGLVISRPPASVPRGAASRGAHRGAGARAPPDPVAATRGAAHRSARHRPPRRFGTAVPLHRTPGGPRGPVHRRGASVTDGPWASPPHDGAPAPPGPGASKGPHIRPTKCNRLRAEHGSVQNTRCHATAPPPSHSEFYQRPPPPPSFKIGLRRCRAVPGGLCGALAAVRCTAWCWRAMCGMEGVALHCVVLCVTLKIQNRGRGLPRCGVNVGGCVGLQWPPRRCTCTSFLVSQ